MSVANIVQTWHAKSLPADSPTWTQWRTRPQNFWYRASVKHFSL